MGEVFIKFVICFFIPVEVAALRKVTPGESEESLRADASLSLLTELQIKQKAETSALEKIIPDKVNNLCLIICKCIYNFIFCPNPA